MIIVQTFSCEDNQKFILFSLPISAARISLITPRQTLALVNSLETSDHTYSLAAKRNVAYYHVVTILTVYRSVQ